MRLALVLLCALLLPLSAAGAQDRSIRIRDFDALLVLSADGTLEVTERLSLRFDGEWNGVQRDLSRRHHTAEGRPRPLRIDVESVTDSAGNELRVEDGAEDDSSIESLRIYVPGARDADRQVVIRYRVRGAVRFFYAGSEPGEMDELY